VFGELRFGPHWFVTGGYDDFDRTSVEKDYGFNRVYGAVGYDLGKQNLLMFDYDRREYDNSALPIDNRYQLALQLKF
jgi:hypothetical protein